MMRRACVRCPPDLKFLGLALLQYKAPTNTLPSNVYVIGGSLLAGRACTATATVTATGPAR